ncbi:MAG: hypothetical protein HQL43_13020 [Alphaproteobacteria bacterium]|nr:hypothetical protein [Alphaproteobacteria bacterium]
MAIDSLTGSAASAMINPANLQPRQPPDAQQRGQDKSSDGASKIMAASDNPRPPSHRGQSVDIKV